MEVPDHQPNEPQSADLHMTELEEELQHPPAHERAARVVWLLAWPAVALNSLQVINTLLDRGFIGHLEQAALTAQGGSTNVMFLMFSLAMALGTAATALVSRAFGAGQIEQFRMAARQSVSVAVGVGLVLAVAGALLAQPSAYILLPPKDAVAIRLMGQYLTAYATGLPAIYLIQTLAGSLRGIGDTKSPMVISGLQILLHITLNFILIFPPRQTTVGITIPGFNLGLVGAGYALSISAWVAAVVYLLYTVRTPLGELWRFSIPSASWVKRIFRIAIPAAGMAILRVGSLMVFTLILAHVANGSVAIAAMSVGFAVESIMFMPAFGLSMAAAALVGQSLGMKRPERAERLAWTAGHHGALVTLFLSVPIFFAAPYIAHALVGGKDALAAEAALLIRTLCVTETMFAYAMVMIGAMQGAGDTTRPFWITVICMWGLRVPLAYVAAVTLNFGAAGAWFAMSFTQAVQGVFAVWLFRQGQWKLKKV